MVGTLNKVILIGNVGKDPEIRLTQDGKEIASFSLATSETWRDKNNGEKREKTEWHKIVVFFPQLVDIVKKYVRKGKKIYIEGSLQTRKWMDQSNTEKYITEILLQSYGSILILLDGNRNDGSGAGSDDDGSFRSSHTSGSGTSRPSLSDDGAKSSGSKYEIEDTELDDEVPF